MPARSSLPLVQATQPALRTRAFGRAMEGYASIASTNTRALQWAREGAEEGSVVVAEHQSAGRGRHGRRWTARAGQNLMFSIALRPGAKRSGREPLAPQRYGLITLAAGVGVAETIAELVAPLVPRIKWPNDVLLEGRKCCGMLLETFSSGQEGASEATGPVVLGVGLNVSQDDFSDLAGDDESMLTPTSLLLATGQPVGHAPLLAQLLKRLEERYLSLFEDRGAAVRRTYEAQMDQFGERIALRFSASDRRIEGIVRGVADDGALRLETSDGMQKLYAGEVTRR